MTLAPVYGLLTCDQFRAPEVAFLAERGPSLWAGHPWKEEAIVKTLDRKDLRMTGKNLI